MTLLHDLNSVDAFVANRGLSGELIMMGYRKIPVDFIAKIESLIMSADKGSREDYLKSVGVLRDTLKDMGLMQ